MTTGGEGDPKETMVPGRCVARAPRRSRSRGRPPPPGGMPSRDSDHVELIPCYLWIIYRSPSGVHPGFKANFRLLPAQDYVAELCGFIPPPWKHETIAYGE